MPLPALAAAGIAAGGSILNNMFGQITNQQNRNWDMVTYNLQRKHALADWRMMNEYNHPSAVMARLREAGLNPNLVYGNGAQTQAGSVRSTQMHNTPFQAPQFDTGSVLQAYYDVQLREAQLDNLRTQNTVMEQDKLLKMAQIVKTQTDSRRGEVDIQTKDFDLMMKNKLAETAFEMQQQQLRKLTADTQYTIDQNERAAALQEKTLTKMAEEIINLRIERLNRQAQTQYTQHQIQLLEQQRQNIINDSTLKQLDIELKRLGVQPNDSMIWRILGRIIGSDPSKGGSEGRTAPNNIVPLPGD